MATGHRLALCLLLAPILILLAALATFGRSAAASNEPTYDHTSELLAPELTGSPTPTATPSPVCTVLPYVFATSTGQVDPGTLDTGSHCDDCVVTVTLPFPVRFYGASYTSVVASSNGVLQFTGASVAHNNTCLPNASLSNALFPYWDDLRTDGAGGTAGIFSSVTGTAPGRVFNVEWRACLWTSDNDPCTTVTTSFEVRLFENSDALAFIYGPTAQAGQGATIGVQRTTGSNVTQYSCNASALSPSLAINWQPLTCGAPTPTVTNSRTPTPLASPTATHTPVPGSPTPPTSATATASRTVTPTATPCGVVVIAGDFSDSDPTQAGRLQRVSAGVCGVTSPFPGVADNAIRHFDSYALVNYSGNTRCVTVSYTGA